MSSSKSPVEAPYADRVYRSPAGMAGGVLLAGLVAWLAGDAVVRGDGRTPWFAIATVLLIVPVIVAFMLRPAVLANDDRMRVRNPFRTVTLPWATVETFRAGYSTEVHTTDGRTFSLWAVPVSLRQRKRAARQNARKDKGTGTMEPPRVAQSDQTVRELRMLAEQNASRPSARGAVEVRWAYELLAPVAVGVVLMTVLAAIGG
ncbi:PH domain-containing protein [Streptomyces sp. NPDC057638]|uniref:PH domain-containing protein n=1 Tax=Streptomyces sp. NPDC057638 TaxID=3346190 RepID=UPI00369ED683